MPFSKKDNPCIRYSHKVLCHDCSRYFPDSQSLVQHLTSSSAHNEECFGGLRNQICSICNLSFFTKESLIQHLQDKPSHQRDLHLAACIGNVPFTVESMRTQYANQTGCSHESSRYNEQLGFTPMHCAAFGGHKDCLKVMLNWDDGDPNVKDPADGRTPVHIAAWKGNPDCLQILLHHGGNPKLSDIGGQTALNLATPACKTVIRRHLNYYKDLRRMASWVFKFHVPPTISCLDEIEMRPVSARILRQRSVELVEDLSQLSLVTAGTTVLLGPVEQAVSPTLPCEVLARGPVAVEAFNNALSEGEACVSRMQLAVIGDIGAGKTSLVRTLKGAEFVAERHETHGIDRSMVEMTELDSSWHQVDLDKSQLDDIIADKVCEDIRGSTFFQEDSYTVAAPREITLHSSPVEAVQDLNPFDFRSPQAAGQGSDEEPKDCKTALGERKMQRQMPVEKIAESLSRETSDAEEPKLYAKISIWDFAGHPLYETMHHIFLNSRSFYLVVFNLVKFVKDETGTLETLRFWLKSVRVHTPTSTPMFLVGTHRDQVNEKDVLKAEKVTHDELSDCFGLQLVPSKAKCYLFAVDNSRASNDDGASALKTMIEKEAHRMEHVVEKLPIRWLHFEEEILKVQVPHENCKLQVEDEIPRCMTKDDLRALTHEKCGAISSEEFHSMVQFFHDSGVVILPEALIGPSAQDHQEMVVLDPQYLVDVMTRLHDIETHMEEDRRFRGHWNTLKEEGFATMELLEFAWKSFDNPAKDLVGILVAAGLLCPVQVQIAASREKGSQTTQPPAEPSPSHPNKDSADTGPEDLAVRTFVVPFHLAKRDLQRKWTRNCRKWKGICSTDKVLIFDFQNFLPPALFNYLLVRTTAESKKTNGMQPIMARDMGIFSFGDKFFLLLKRIGKYNQIQVNIRHKHRENLHEVFTTLKLIMSGICNQYFKFLKITLGPPCPNPSCPGASEEGKVLKRDSSSEESEEDDEAEEDEWCSSLDNGNANTDSRQHVISIDPSCPEKPLWCNSDPLHEFEEIKQWFMNQAVDIPMVAEKDQLCVTRVARPVERCCLVVITKKTSPNWKMVGRYLNVDEYTMKNIQADNPSNQQEQAYQLLQTWMTQKGPKATQEALTEALMASDRYDIVEDLGQHYVREHQEPGA